MRFKIPFLLASAACFSLATNIAAPAAANEELPRSAGTPYAAKGVPDRIMLTPAADPARAMAVSWRTDARQQATEAQITVAVDGPTLGHGAQSIVGAPGITKNSANGPAIYHKVRFDNLTPDTVYAYRLKGSAGWSEWLQFRTAAATPEPFRFLYLGDVQNGILTYASRVIRQAFRSNGEIELVLLAGDLVSQRDDLDHDDEWGEFNEAGGYNWSIAPQIPATGNHEYIDVELADGSESRKLGPYWPLQFALPDNGADGVKATTYFVDYQGVRFIVLDGTSAIDLGTMEEQTRWLDKTLASSAANWNVVLFHQPVFTCARPDDTSEVKAAWKPVFESRKVDLVLQGHDHCYSRLTSEAGKEASARMRADGKVQGPVYLVSVTGSKMYRLNDRADTQPDRVAEATELYQIVDVDGDTLRFRTYTASGSLYDGFDLNRGKDGNRLSEIDEPTIAERICRGDTGPDGGPCVARAK
ncbi:purple acid phosphatase family protein [Croceicoccus gelatinilyticus]|uniref:purple acid phosphatase family protein n=1 Tax=Croceicoccus gelatinilyticus TaxID=2835536 RepID=UPI001BCB2B2E|nr:metallophosphoesterase family protein [Croceicoccus gelatinilyticus]MBS7668714.1 metallophosphoesterase family protein [Croceicoccus gelatinilyticus]